MTYYDNRPFLALLEKRSELEERSRIIACEANDYLRTFGRYDRESEETLARLGKQIEALDTQIEAELSAESE